MAAGKQGGRASVPPDDVTVGRAIMALRSYKNHPRYGWNSRAGRYTLIGTEKRHFSDQQIMDLLHLSKKDFDRCLLARMDHPPRMWTVARLRNVFFTFVRENQRWPTATDYKNWRENGLPSSRRTLDGWFGGEWQLIEQYIRRYGVKKMPARMVLTIPNITTRRDAIEQFGGIDKLILNGGGRKIQQDDFGTLWRLPSDGIDSRVLYVEVVNKTPRVDKKGAYVRNKQGDFVYDHYFLRVPPATVTARQAVAWTFNIPARDFAGFAAES